MNYLVIYPGRFHPFHRGHLASYEYLTKKYGVDSVYIATSDVQAPVTSPFSYQEKVAMMTKLGVPASHIVKVKNPYRANEIVDNLPEEEKDNTVLIFAVSEKDRGRFQFGIKRNGEASYMQPLPENIKQLKPLTQHAYVDVTPTVNFKVRGADANSASEIRQKYIKGNEADREQILTDLYGFADAGLKDIFDAKLGVAERAQGFIKEAHNMRTERSVDWLERVLILERQAHPTPLTEDLCIDYIDEKNS
jgi:FAD synthase